MTFAYIIGVCVEMKQGAVHLKFIYSDELKAPVLLKSSACCMGQDSTWMYLVDECVGYSQLETCLNCYIRPDRLEFCYRIVML